MRVRDGVAGDISLSREQALARTRDRYTLAVGHDESALAAWVRLGSLLLQLRPNFAHGTWGPFLKAAGFRHLNEATRAVNLAREYSDAHGELDQHRVAELFARWNSEHPGLKPLDPASPSLHAAASAAGIPGVVSRSNSTHVYNLDDGHAPPSSGANGGRAHHLDGPLTEDEEAMFLFEGERSLVTMVGAERAAVVKARVADKAAAAKVIGESGAEVQGARTADAVLPPRVQQLTLAPIYATAAASARKLLGMLERGDVDASVADAFAAWCGEQLGWTVQAAGGGQ